jgi:LDH2 family malate/lactate/ureidoglycolate dehydrogenase
MSHQTDVEARRIDPAKLRDFAVAVLSRAGMPGEDAGLCADAMVWSDLRGRPAHGVAGRLPQVLTRLREGVNPAPEWRVVGRSTGVAVLDADGGWGQVAGTRAMALAVTKAAETGIGATVVRNADIAAALGRYPDLAVDQRMIGLAVNNTWPIMPPWGSRTGLLGNQAFAIGAPAGRHPPILFDSALSAMSRRQVEAVRDRGENLPPGVALNSAGEPTVDPIEALAGVLLPTGGHRGGGLALMWEVLTGVLAGGRTAPDVGGTPLGISMFCLAIDPASIMRYDDFTARIDRLIDAIQASRPAAGFDEVRVPGAPGYELARAYARDGIPMDPEQTSVLRDIGLEHGVAEPA